MLRSNRIQGCGHWHPCDGKPAGPNPLGLSEHVAARGLRYLTTQDALDEYGKDGWQLVTQSYLPGDQSHEHFISMRK